MNCNARCCKLASTTGSASGTGPWKTHCCGQRERVGNFTRMTGASPVGCGTRQTETLKRAGQRHFKGDGGQESAIAGFTTLPAPAPWWALFPG